MLRYVLPQVWSSLFILEVLSCLFRLVCLFLFKQFYYSFRVPSKVLPLLGFRLLLRKKQTVFCLVFLGPKSILPPIFLTFFTPHHWSPRKGTIQLHELRGLDLLISTIGPGGRFNQGPPQNLQIFGWPKPLLLKVDHSIYSVTSV